jgi:hypothetical protein
MRGVVFVLIVDVVGGSGSQEPRFGWVLVIVFCGTVVLVPVLVGGGRVRFGFFRWWWGFPRLGWRWLPGGPRWFFRSRGSGRSGGGWVHGAPRYF